MITGYILTAFRQIRKEKLQSCLVIGGMAVGFAVALLAGLFVADEYSFDRFHSRSDRTYRLTKTVKQPDGNVVKTATVMGPLMAALTSEFPEVEASTRLLTRQTIGRTGVTVGEKGFYEDNVVVALASFFDVFDFSMRTGDGRAALSRPQNIVLTESAALKYFGTADAIGRMLKTDRYGELVVGAVVNDPPSNSHIQFGMLVSEATLAAANPRWPRFSENWEAFGFTTYILTRESVSPAAFDERVNSLVARHIEKADGRPVLAIQSLTDVHLHSGEILNDFNVLKSDPVYARIVGVIALLVLGIASINYINVATARIVTRQKEIGLRKVTGARRGDLVQQFMTEACVFAGLALLIGLLVAQSALPLFNDIAGRKLEFRTIFDGPFLSGAAMLFFILTVLTGLYPGLFLSSVQPMQVIRNQVGSMRHGWLRRILVVGQFTTAIVAIVVTFVVYRQLEFVRSRDLGFTPASRVVVDINSGRVRRSALQMRDELQNVSGVQAVTVASRVPGEWKDIDQVDIAPADQSSQVQRVFFFGGDERFVDVFGMKLIAGRNFISAGDTASVILNQSAVQALGGGELLGRDIILPKAKARLRVIGIVSDFHFQSLHEPIRPAAIGYWQNPVNQIDYFTASIAAGQVQPILRAFEQVHNRFDGVTPIEVNILTDRLNDFYVKDERSARIFSAAAIITIVVALVGLFGLVTFAVERRTKEVGIRKVLGASVWNVTTLIAGEFALLVLVANAIAWPLAYLTGQRWLEQFAYRTEWSWAVVAAAGSISLILAMATISVHTLRTAFRNPVETLRYE